MLVVKRKKGESIIIGDNIEVNIVEIDGASVKISIDAPREISILRKELLNEVQKENKNALTFDVNIIKNLKK